MAASQPSSRYNAFVAEMTDLIEQQHSLFKKRFQALKTCIEKGEPQEELIKSVQDLRAYLRKRRLKISVSCDDFLLDKLALSTEKKRIASLSTRTNSSAYSTGQSTDGSRYNAFVSEIMELIEWQHSVFQDKLQAVQACMKRDQPYNKILSSVQSLRDYLKDRDLKISVNCGDFLFDLLTGEKKQESDWTTSSDECAGQIGGLKDEKKHLVGIDNTQSTKIEEMTKVFKEREIKQKEESEDRERNFNDYIHQIQADNSRLKTTIEQLGAEVNQYRSFAEESHNAASKLDQMLKKSKEEIEKLKAEKIQQFEDSDQKIKKLTEEKKHIHSENIQLKSRVSELTGANLVDIKSDIAGLSDPNRAMKLGENFSSLYDDDWTDIFQILTENFKMAEETAINYLLIVVEGAYDFCRKIGDEQMDILCNVFDNPCQDIPKALTFKPQTEKSQLSQKHHKELKDLRKKIALNQVNSISKKYLALESEEAKKGDKTAKQLFDQTKSYYEKCVEICWPMILHDPPVRMERKAQPGSKIDLNRFRLYGGNGSVMDYLVWPPLLVEGGGLLAKGVAKPKKEVRTVKKP